MGSRPVKAKVAFLFDSRPVYPPDYNNMKCYYVSQELTKRGIEVAWVNMGDQNRVVRTDKVSFVSLKIPTIRVASTLLNSFMIVVFCLVHSVRIVYIDGWFYFRDSPLRQLATIVTLRIFGRRVVLDQRDPYLDFEVSRGAVQPGTLRHTLLKIHERITLYVCSLLILPSKAYERLFASEGASPKKVRGFFRGIDLNQFNPSVSGERIRLRLDLDQNFVVGWFGMMYRHRQVKEVLIPLAESLSTIVPNSRMIIGGRGPFEGALLEAKRGDRGNQFDYVGPVKYSELPEYLSACDVLLCPVSTQSRFSRHSNWLKILEGIAMGVPVIATKTEASVIDLWRLKGIVWTGESLADFQTSIVSTYRDLQHIKTEAREQARSLLEFGIDRTIPQIVDQVLQAGL